MTIVFVRNDTGFNITLDIEDSSSEDISLASVSTVILKMKKMGALSTTIFGTCTVSDISAGIVTYAVQAGDFAEVGNYETELQITYPSNKIITASFDDIYITEDL